MVDVSQHNKVAFKTFSCLLFYFPARGYTSAYMNPSLAYGLTFHCPGFTSTEYALVYWLGSFTGKLLNKFNICISYWLFERRTHYSK